MRKEKMRKRKNLIPELEFLKMANSSVSWNSIESLMASLRASLRASSMARVKILAAAPTLPLGIMPSIGRDNVDVAAAVAVVVAVQIVPLMQPRKVRKKRF